MEEGDADWERAHLIGWKCVEERDADWERAHSRVEGNGRQRCQMEEGTLDRVGMVWRRETPTGRERT